jgi:hypothetical protein
MAKTAMMQEEIEVPDGGIAELVMDDQTADEVYGADEEEVPSGGIAQFESVADQMAAMGREGDNMLAHLESGELVIPRRFLEENEEFKSYVMAFFDGQGVDPERYIAGSDANSLNPETGIAEFFLKKLFKKVKKAVKKVGKTVKKVVKKVVAVAKKVAPVVLPIAMPFMFPALGAVYGAAAGGGIATLLRGGSVKDALKSALISGATGAAIKGAGALIKGVNPMTAIGKELADPMGRISQSFSKGFGGAYTPPEVPEFDQRVTFRQEPSLDGKTITSETNLDLPETNLVKTAGEMPVNVPEGSGTFSKNFEDIFKKGGKGPLEAAKDAFLPSGPTATDIFEANTKNPNMSIELAKQYAIEQAPGLLAKTLPALGAGVGALALTGGFKKPPQEDPGLVEYAEDGTAITGEDKIAADPGKYLVDNLTGRLSDGSYEVGSNYRLDPRLPRMPDNPFLRPTFPQMIAKEGGDVPDLANDPRLQAARMYPRRNGAIMPNEGIPDKDSVRALLMPGEFVMTTDAVKGLGGGSMNQGINNMYSVMRNLESRGRQTA